MGTRALEGLLGYKGERGYSAYEIAVLNGYEGTEQEWINHFGLDLSGYLQNTDVIDALDSTYIGRPLSANMGKTLDEKIDTQINNVKEVHTYSISKTSGNDTATLTFKEVNNVVTIKAEVVFSTDSTGKVFTFKLTDLPDWAKISEVKTDSNILVNTLYSSNFSSFNSSTVFGLDNLASLSFYKKGNDGTATANNYICNIASGRFTTGQQIKVVVTGSYIAN
jgi:hypothetical protein